MLIVLVSLSVFMLSPNVKSSIVKVFSNTSSALMARSLGPDIYGREHASLGQVEATRRLIDL